MELKEKEKRLAVKNLQASRLFHTFVSQMGQTEMPDEETYKKLTRTIDQARKNMERTKMKPLQTTRSFESWRHSIEKSVEKGLTYYEPRTAHSMPKRFEKHLIEVKKRRQQMDIDSELEYDAPMDFHGEETTRSYQDKKVRENSVEIKGSKKQIKETLFRNFGHLILQNPNQ